jgi:thiol-disulfide isomerase/thioredoxin
MRLFPHAVLTLLVAAVGCSAQEKKDEEKKPEKPKLAIGDPAPAITSAKWLKGPETKFEKGKVYVVEFWATWCGPCIQSMPHLTTLLDEYKAQGLTVVAVTTKDENGNTEEAVGEYLKKRGDRFPFAFAFCTTDETNKAFMDASGTDGIPASFVVDQQGKVAFIGHPMELDDVLPRVFAGTWQGQKSLDEIQKEKDALDAILDKVQSAAVKAETANKGKGKEEITKAVGDAAAVAAAEVLTLLPDYEKTYPVKAKQPIFGTVKLAVSLQARKFDEAAAISEPLIKHAAEKKDTSTLNRVRSFWVAKALNPDRKGIDQAVKAAEAMVKIDGEDNIPTLLAAAEAYYAAGNKAQAEAFGGKAVKAAGDDAKAKEAIEKVLKKFQE